MRPADLSITLALIATAIGAAAWLVTSKPEPPAGADPFAATEQVIRGIVVDLEDRPLAGVEVTSEGARATSGSDGRFELVVESSWSRFAPWVDVVPGDFARVATTHLDEPDPDAEHVVVAAPAGRVAGRVVDPSGRPVRAQVYIPFWPSLLRGLDRPLDQLGRGPEQITTLQDGTFVAEHLPLVGARGELMVSALGRARGSGSFDAPSEATDDLTFVVTLHELEPDDDGAGKEDPASEPYVLRGTVTDSAGAPLPWALVGTTATDGVPVGSDGQFEIPVDPHRRDAALFAAKRGYAPAIIENVVERFEEAGTPDGSSIAFTLGENRRIVGRVADPSGAAQGNWEVRLMDPVPIAGGASHLSSSPASVEGMRGRVETVSDADGRFELEGLLDRAYRLRLVDHESLQQIEVTARPGTDELVVRATDEGMVEGLTGTIVDRDGAGVADVEIQLTAVLPGAEGESIFRRYATRPVRTDAAGRFVLPRVATDGTTLEVRGPDGMVQEHPLALLALDAPLEIELAARRYLKIVTGPGMPGGLRVTARRADTSTVELDHSLASPRGTNDSLKLLEGENPVVALGDDAVALEFWTKDASGGIEHRRTVPLVFEAEGLTRIEVSEFE